MSKYAICPECNKPCGPFQPGAKVYHMSCLVKKFKALREEWEKETPVFNISGCQTGRFKEESQ